MGRLGTYGFSNDNSGTMIQHDATTNGGIGMNVNLKNLRDLTLQILRQDASSRLPEYMGRAMRLQGVKALEIKKDVGQGVAGGIAVPDCHDVGAQFAAKVGTLLEGR